MQIDDSSVGRIFRFDIAYRDGSSKRVIYLRAVGVEEGAIEVCYHFGRCPHIWSGFLWPETAVVGENNPEYHIDLFAFPSLNTDRSIFIRRAEIITLITDITNCLEQYPECKLTVPL